MKTKTATTKTAMSSDSDVKDSDDNDYDSNDKDSDNKDSYRDGKSLKQATINYWQTEQCIAVSKLGDVRIVPCWHSDSVGCR